MKVKELIDKLSKLDKDALVVIRYDDYCSPLSTTVSTGIYVAKTDSFDKKSEYFGNFYKKETPTEENRENAVALHVKRW